MAFLSRLNARQGPCSRRSLPKACRCKVPVVCASHGLCSKRRASSTKPSGRALASILHGTMGRPGRNDVDDVSSLSEPYGSDGAMAERGRLGAEIPQPCPTGRLRPAVRTARRGAGTDLAHLAHLYAPG